jgi:hypothetical protein
VPALHSHRPIPDWARLLSAILYGIGVFRLLASLPVLPVALGVARLPFGPYYKLYLSTYALSFLIQGSADILAARLIARRPQRTMGVLWTLLALSTCVCATAVGLAVASSKANTPPGVGPPLAQLMMQTGLTWIQFLATYLPALIVLRARREQMLRRPTDLECCVECGYSLIGLTEPRCPECGTAIESHVGKEQE